MKQADKQLIRKHTFTFVSTTIIGIVSLLLGLFLIIVVNYHERAYIFLGLGVGCIIGGITGLIQIRKKFKAGLSYGLIALGTMGIVVGLNYLVDRYGSSPNFAHAVLVLSISAATIIVGIFGAWTVQSKAGIITFLRVLLSGIVASIGIVAVTVSIIYKYALNSSTHAYMLFGVGVICLVIGIVGEVFSRNRAMMSAR